MSIRGPALLAVLAFLVAPFAAGAQPGRKVARVGVVSSGYAQAGPVESAFVRRLRELGWTEGQNIAFEWRYSEDKPDRLPELAADLLRLKVDAILALGTPAALAAKRTAGATPIVMAVVADPVRRPSGSRSLSPCCSGRIR